MHFPSLILASMLSLPLLACGQEQARRQEAAQITDAIDALIMADRKARQPLLDRLRATPCSLPEVCEARRACTDAFAPAVEAARLQAEARALLDEQRPDLTAQVDARLSQAERLQEKARFLQERCISATTHLRQNYRL
ncbi:MAG: hypothetical protein RMJ98_14425 [Myxococcales bacterium]|nr:hypothetical protein [Polyangiaceae bacterium]MDW8250488.1 hypothetical protein [Myxococcales bacterium]